MTRYLVATPELRALIGKSAHFKRVKGQGLWVPADPVHVSDTIRDHLVECTGREVLRTTLDGLTFVGEFRWKLDGKHVAFRKVLEACGNIEERV